MPFNKYTTPPELKKSLNLIIAAITFGMVMFTVTGIPVGAPAFTGFIRLLGAGDLLYGIVMALPVMGGVAQVLASFYIERTGKRKSIFLIFGFIHRLLWIPVALIPLSSSGLSREGKIWLITLLITIGSIASSIVSVSFMSWIGDLIPTDIKGRFFGKRAAISAFMGAATGLAIGKILDSGSGLGTFAAVLSVAAFMGALDIMCFIWVKHPPMAIRHEDISFRKIIREPFRDRNYMKFILFVSAWSFGFNIPAPFFYVYMIEYLNMGYFKIALFAQVFGSLLTILFVSRLGRLIDSFGSKPVMKMCCTISISLPVLWIFATPASYNIILFINMAAGIINAGYELTVLNLSIWLAPEKNRSAYIATYALVNSVIGIAIAYIVGGLLMEVLRPLLNDLSIPFILGQELNAFHILFILSGLLRAMALLFLHSGFKETHAEGTFSVRAMLKGLKRV